MDHILPPGRFQPDSIQGKQTLLVFFTLFLADTHSYPHQNNKKKDKFSFYKLTYEMYQPAGSSEPRFSGRILTAYQVYESVLKKNRGACPMVGCKT
jgi:hypothetical protein